MEPCEDAVPATGAVSLSVDERMKIALLFVKPGKIGGLARSREKSEVWTCFGELCYRDPEQPPGDASVVSLDASRHYCLVCLENVKSQPELLRDVNQLQSYSTATSTATLAEHLHTKHSIQICKVNRRRKATSE